MSNSRGFTLIELMIVIAIIAILAAIAIPSYQNYVAKAQVTESMGLISGVGRNVLQHYWQTNQCPASGVGEFPARTDSNGRYVEWVEVGGTATSTGGCTIAARMRASGVNAGVQGGEILFTLVTSEGSSTWTCTSTLAQRYLPSRCTGT